MKFKEKNILKNLCRTLHRGEIAILGDKEPIP